MLHHHLPTKASTRNNAHILRRTLTPTEKMLWRKLRARRLHHHKFRRQVPLGPYIADFFCVEKNLIIEIDGGSHTENILYDQKRDTYFHRRGIHVLRFWNVQVFENLEGVLEAIADALEVDR